MKRKNLTRNALVTSILSLVLCASMLVGTTFAWFTDEVSTASNTIVSGKLQVELLDANGDSLEGQELKFVQVDANDVTIAALTDPLWEPGATFVTEEFKIVNKGNLHLKYTVLVTGIDGNAKLNEVIEWTVDGDPAMTGTLAPDASTGTFRLSGHMMESATNEYQDLTMSGIGITVYATQATVENDSFGNQYDVDAEMPTTVVSNIEELTAALVEGGMAALSADVNVVEPITIPADVASILDLNGHKISYSTPAAEANYHALVVQGDLNVTGSGTIELIDESGAAFNPGIQSTAISVQGGTLTLGEGVIVNSQAGAEMAYAVDVNTTLGDAVLNVNGATLKSSYIGVRIFNNHATAQGVVNFNSGVIEGAKKGYDIWAQNMSNPAENAIVNIADGITYTTEDLSGVIYYID